MLPRVIYIGCRPPYCTIRMCYVYVRRLVIMYVGTSMCVRAYICSQKAFGPSMCSKVQVACML